MSASGRLISFEGIDGSGKSTQAHLLAEALTEHGRQVVLTREPGGSPGAELIRRLLVEGETDRWSPETEALLFTAARRDHMERLIAPALEAGRVVITDRFADSTRVYQGAVRTELAKLVDKLHRMMIGREPDLTILIDVDPDAAWERSVARSSREVRFERFGREFQAGLREAFLDLARRTPERCRIVDGNRPAQVVAAEVSAIALTLA